MRIDGDGLDRVVVDHRARLGGAILAMAVSGQITTELLKPLDALLRKPDAIELKVNGPGGVWVENRKGAWVFHKIPALSFAYWKRLGSALGIGSGQDFHARKPLIRAILPGGHRIMMVLGPDVLGREGQSHGVTVAIRLNRRSKVALEDFGLDAAGSGLLEQAVRERRNILVAGGVGSGKTTLTNILCSKIADAAPIYIEDTNELDQPQDLATGFLISPVISETEIDYRDVLDAIIRLRPDRIIIGELNSDNAFITLRCLNLGSEGLLSTIHADSAADAIDSLIELLALGGAKATRADLESYYRRKLHVVVYVKRDGDKRRVTEIFDPGEGGKTLWTSPTPSFD